MVSNSRKIMTCARVTRKPLPQAASSNLRPRLPPLMERQYKEKFEANQSKKVEIVLKTRIKMVQVITCASMTILLALVSLGSCAPASLFGDTVQQLQQLGLEAPALPLISPKHLTNSYNTDFGVDYDPEDAEAGSLFNNITLDESDSGASAAAALASEKYGQTLQEMPDDSSHPTNIGPANLNLSTTSNILFGSGGRKSHIIRWPNAQSTTVQSCVDGSPELRCEDENAVCELGGCVCKRGYYLHRQSGLCQSISDLLKNCENDHQCQAFNVDMICDTKSHERPFCDCTEGLYHDQETHTCLPCLRPSLLSSPITTPPTSTPSTKNLSSTNDGSSDQTQSIADAGNVTTDELNPNNANIPNVVRFSNQQVRLCKPNDFVRVGGRRRQQNINSAGLSPYDRQLYEQTLRGPSMPPISTAISTISSSSDPFRIRTPLEVFMGAIMLFTLFTVAWFFLQRMIHDCRAILRSLRNPEFSGSGGSTDPSFVTTGGPLNNFASSRSSYFDPHGQAVARLFTNDGLNGSPFTGLTSSIYQRDLAGVMVQHLAANLSPSSTSHALAGNGSSRAFGLGHNEHDAALYPLTASAQQSRTAAAAAAAQLLLSPTHPAIAILRAAAAAHNPGADYASTNLLNSMFDPPPKYEEAIAQSDYQQQHLQSQNVETPPSQLAPEQPIEALAQPGDQNPGLGNIRGQAAHSEPVSADTLRSTDQRDGCLSIYIPPQSENHEQQASADDLLRVASFPGNAADANNETILDSNSRMIREARDETNNQRRASLSERRSSRRSRRGRGSVARPQQKTQDSD